MAQTSKKKFKTYDIFVGNLPSDYDQKNVTRMFSKIGEINAVIMRENNGQKYAFVRFISETDAEKACEKHGSLADGKKIIVRRSEAKKKLGEESAEVKGGEEESCPPQAEQTQGSDTASVGSGQAKEMEDKGSLGLQPQKNKGKGDTMMITHVESPVMYWAQAATEANMEGLLSVANELRQLCPAASPLTGPPEVNKTYAAKFSEDHDWYRCQIRGPVGPKKVKIQYVDYGNYEEVNPDTLVEIPASVASIKPFAQKCLLHEILPAKRNDQAGIEFMRNLLENRYVQVVPIRRLTDQMGNYVDMYLGDTFLNEKVVESGYGVKRPLMQRMNQFGSAATNLNSSNNNSSGINSNNACGSFPGAGLLGSGYSSAPSNLVIGGGFGTGGDADPLSALPLSSRFPATAEPGKMPFPPFDSSIPPPPTPDRALQAELAVRIRDLEKLRAEKEKANAEVQFLRNKMKSLQGEYTQVSKMLENSFSSQMQQSFELGQKVRAIRSQFPTANRRIPLDEAISQFVEEELECEVPLSVPTAISMLMQYNKAQKDIYLCKSVEETKPLLEPRNELRHEMYEHLVQGIEDLEAMPLAEKKESLKKAMESLRKHYAGFFKYSVQGSPPLESLVQGYKQFRDEKIKRFEETRKSTDEIQRGLKEVFAKIQMSMDLDQEPDAEGQEKLSQQLEALVKLSNQALQQEIQASDIENSSEGRLMAALVQGLESFLHLQLSGLEELLQKLGDFRQTRDSTKMWLSSTPTVDPINDVRKTLRGLKSKLRHRLADLQDAEEGGDDESLQTIEDDIAAIRLSIHKTLVEEDGQLMKLMAVADNHFPELLRQYPDLGIETFKANSCLVKPSLEPDHLDMKPVSGVSANLFQSFFADVAVLIREHLLSDADKCSKDDFLKEMKLYAKIKKPHLQPLQAVFFDKNFRHAYVKTSKTGELLCNFVAQHGRCSNEMIQQIFHCLVSAVISLHGEGLVHGEVTPENILVLPNGNATLLEPDFSRSRLERCRKRYVSSNGLEFLSPELRSLSSSNAALFRGDNFNLGMLLVWLHFPDQRIQLLPNGMPSMPDMFDVAVLEVFTLLMLPNPKFENGLDSSIMALSYLSHTGNAHRSTPSPCPSPQLLDGAPRLITSSQGITVDRGALFNQQRRTPTPPSQVTPSPPPQVPAPPISLPQPPVSQPQPPVSQSQLPMSHPPPTMPQPSMSQSQLPMSHPPPTMPPPSMSQPMSQSQCPVTPPPMSQPQPPVLQSRGAISSKPCVIDTFDPSLADNLPASSTETNEDTVFPDTSGWDPKPLGGFGRGSVPSQPLGRRLQPLLPAVRSPMDVPPLQPAKNSLPASGLEQDLAGLPDPPENEQLEEEDQLGENGWGRPDPLTQDNSTGWEEEGASLAVAPTLSAAVQGDAVVEPEKQD